MFIKVCGMTTPRGGGGRRRRARRRDRIRVRGVDAESDAEAARAARGRGARPRALFAVTKHPDAAAIDEIVEVFEPDVLQTDAEDFADPASAARARAASGAARGRRTSAAAAAALLFEGPSAARGVLSDWTERARRRSPLAPDPRGRPERRQRRRGHHHGAPLRRRRVQRRRSASRHEEPAENCRFRQRRALGAAQGDSSRDRHYARARPPAPARGRNRRTLPRCARPLRPVRRPLCARDADSRTRASRARHPRAPARRRQFQKDLAARAARAGSAARPRSRSPRGCRSAGVRRCG